MGVLLFLLCLLCAVDIAQTQDCNDLSGRYFCIDNDTFKEQIDWCWCYYGDNPGKWILDPYAFVGGGYMATQLYFYPNGNLGRDFTTGVRSNVCSPTTHFPVYVGEVLIYEFGVSYDYQTKRNQIAYVSTYRGSADCMYPSLSSKITVVPPGFVCPGGPVLDRDFQNIQRYKYGDNKCGCQCIEPPKLKQCELSCSKKLYDATRRNVCALGCALTSLVSLMNYAGCNVDVCEVNICRECFTKEGSVKWDTIIQKYCPNKLKFVEKRDSCPKSPEEWRKFHCDGKEFAILKVLRVDPTEQNRNKNRRQYRSHYHFVLFKCLDKDGNILSMDPAYSGRYEPGQCKGVRVFRKN